MARRFGAALAAALLLALGACATGTPAPGPKSASIPSLDQVRAGRAPPASPTVLPGWAEDRHADALPALLQSCRSLTIQRMIAIGVEATPDDWVEVCLAATRIPAEDHAAARRFFEESFTPVKVETEDGANGRFTGYYEAQLRGSWERTKRYHVPLYAYPGRPAGKPLPPRAQIAKGALRKQKLELIWVDSEFDAYVLEIQGSGRVYMEDGSVVGIGYAGQNGHRFVDVTQVAHRQGAIPDRSFDSLKRYLDRLTPARRQTVMNHNPSFVFFRVREGKDPIGAQGVPLTPGRSLAVDPRHVPLGALVWLHIPNGPGGEEIRRLVVAQDTGGAITGPVRGDVFWGHGAQARGRALATNAQGQYYMLVPKTHTILTQLQK